ncbi:MAG: RNA-protein complex protein Nop10 [Methanotrichaceae archaeon]|nr:RNA-protein complex protein Nop10 [Methanotrichaceae archaeon]
MRSKILKCPVCGRYTLRDRCPSCGASTITTRPARFSPEDPYGRYRRALKS